MSLIFELSLSCEDERSAASCVGHLSGSLRSQEINGHEIKFEEPTVRRSKSRSSSWEFHIDVVPIGERLESVSLNLNTEELTELGKYLYEVIRPLSEFDLALVGWDVDWISEIELLDGWPDQRFRGLVVVKHLAQGPLNHSNYAQFSTTHSWIPYRGTTDWYSEPRGTNV